MMTVRAVFEVTSEDLDKETVIMRFNEQMRTLIEAQGKDIRLYKYINFEKVFLRCQCTG